MKKKRHDYRIKKANVLPKDIETMIPKRLLSLPIIDSEGFIRLLDDTATSGMYLVFNGKFNQTHYAKSYQVAERFFRRQIELAD